MLGFSAGDCMTSPFHPGDYIKVEFAEGDSGESEWMWVVVDSCDEEGRLVFGCLDSVPIVHANKLKLGQNLAVSFDQVREHKKGSSF